MTDVAEALRALLRDAIKYEPRALGRIISDAPKMKLRVGDEILTGDLNYEEVICAAITALEELNG